MAAAQEIGATTAAPEFTEEQLVQWSRAISTVIRHTGKPVRPRRHGRPGSTHHPFEPRVDNLPVGSPMAVEHLLVHLHHPIPLEVLDRIIHMEPRLA